MTTELDQRAVNPTKSTTASPSLFTA